MPSRAEGPRLLALGATASKASTFGSYEERALIEAQLAHFSSTKIIEMAYRGCSADSPYILLCSGSQ